jgi:hypothetical protein
LSKKTYQYMDSSWNCYQLRTTQKQGP